jgi:hypothetical protein
MRNYRVRLLASAVRAATTATTKQVNRRHTSVLLTLSVTVASGTGGLTLSIRGYDPVSGNTITLLQDGAPILATGTYGFALGPWGFHTDDGLRAAEGCALPLDWDVSIAHGDGSDYTYSLAATLSR